MAVKWTPPIHTRPAGHRPPRYKGEPLADRQIYEKLPPEVSCKPPSDRTKDREQPSRWYPLRCSGCGYYFHSKAQRNSHRAANGKEPE